MFVEVAFEKDRASVVTDKSEDVVELKIKGRSVQQR
jgi:hypothetical protein